MRVGFLLAVIWICLTSCGKAPYQEAGDYLKASNQQLHFPNGFYKNVAWFNSTLIALLYLPPEAETPYKLGNWKMIIYDLNDNAWLQLQVPVSSDCSTTWYTNLRRLPNQHLGFTQTCVPKNNDTPHSSLVEWNPTTGEFQTLREYQASIKASSYSFSPDMSQLLQENAVNAGLGNQLLRINKDGTQENLFPGWRRAKEPAWSPNGEKIAFVGNPSLGDKKDDGSFDSIKRDFLFPWNLYVMDSSYQQVTMVWMGAADWELKWHPSGKAISVSGEYGQTKGVWLIDPQATDVFRIWSDMDYYDWSPDGTQIVIVDGGSPDGDYGSQPILLDVPSPLFK